MPRRRGTGGSASLDLKLMAGIYYGHDLISGVHARSDDQEPTGRGVAAQVAVDLCPRRSAAAWHQRASILGSRACYKAYKQAQSIEATVLVLTGVCFGSEMPRGMVVGEVRAAALGRGRRRVDAVVLWAC